MDIYIFAKRLKECRENAGLSQRDLAKKLHMSNANVSRYEKAEHGPGRSAINDLANFFNVSPAWLMGANVHKYTDDQQECKNIPIIGTIAAGIPILAEENIEGYECVSVDFNVDFCLRVKGDSMIGARILDGDLVYIHKQPYVENGEIAVVVIDGEATLKKFYSLNGNVILRAENPNYPEMIFKKKDMKHIFIEGKAVFFKSEVK
ncbi:MAG: transcriptional repressor LexA [Eubacteriales bacterium]|jgi:repressor LexA